MGLPIQTAPSYTTTLPSDGREVKFRPFLVKEQKILVLARESENLQEQIRAVKDLLHNVTDGECNADEMYSADVEWLFLQVRLKSVGEEVKTTFQCGQDDCNGTGVSVIDLSKVEVQGEVPEDTTVMINDEVGVILELPTFKDVSSVDATKNEAENVLTIVSKSIKQIFSGDQVFDKADMSQEELTEFIESLTFGQLEQLGGFFDDAPKLALDVSYKCNTCGKEQIKNLTGLQSFF